MSLIGWEEVCQPKECGGLGLRKLKECNEAFMIKLGWQLLVNQSALWVKIIRTKYMNIGDHLPVPKVKSNCSYV